MATSDADSGFSEVIPVISGVEESGSSQSKNIISELRSEYNLGRVDKPQEKRGEESGRRSKAGVTIVRVGGSRGDVSRWQS